MNCTRLIATCLMMLFLSILCSRCRENEEFVRKAPGQLPFFKVYDTKGNLIYDSSFRTGTAVFLLCDRSVDKSIYNFFSDFNHRYNVSVNPIIVTNNHELENELFVVVRSYELYSAFKDNGYNKILIYTNSRVTFQSLLDSMDYDDLKFNLIRSVFGAKNLSEAFNYNSIPKYIQISTFSKLCDIYGNNTDFFYIFILSKVNRICNNNNLLSNLFELSKFNKNIKYLVVLYDYFTYSDIDKIEKLLKIDLDFIIADSVIMSEINKLINVNFKTPIDFYLIFDVYGNLLSSKYFDDLCDDFKMPEGL